MGLSEKPHPLDVKSVDSEKWVVDGISLKSPLEPILTKLSTEKRGIEEDEEDEEEKEEYICVTPTSPRSRIPSDLPCPPAPKRRRPVSSGFVNENRIKQFCEAELENTFQKLEAILRRRI